jgi:hypothetical protein
MGTMSMTDPAPLPRLGEVFFDVRSKSRSLRISWYADTGVAVLSIWQGGTCTGSFRLPMGDLPRLIEALQAGPSGWEGPGDNGAPATGAMAPPAGYAADPAAAGSLHYLAGSAAPDQAAFDGAPAAYPDLAAAGYPGYSAADSGGYPAADSGHHTYTDPGRRGQPAADGYLAADPGSHGYPASASYPGADSGASYPAPASYPAADPGHYGHAAPAGYPAADPSGYPPPGYAGQGSGSYPGASPEYGQSGLPISSAAAPAYADHPSFPDSPAFPDSPGPGGSGYPDSGVMAVPPVYTSRHGDPGYPAGASQPDYLPAPSAPYGDAGSENLNRQQNSGWDYPPVVSVGAGLGPLPESHPYGTPHENPDRRDETPGPPVPFG